MVSSSPSLIVYSGSYPNISRAREISANDILISPSRGGLWIMGTSFPAIFFIRSASSLREVCMPHPTLNTPWISLSIARIFADTTSLTKTKSRVCSPSPKIVIGFFCFTCAINFEMTPEYSEWGPDAAQRH